MLTGEDIRRLCALSKLELSEEDIEVMRSEMDGIIAFADTVCSVEVDEESLPLFGRIINAMREDEVRQSYDNELILKNADGENGYFRIQKLL